MKKLLALSATAGATIVAVGSTEQTECVFPTAIYTGITTEPPITIKESMSSFVKNKPRRRRRGRR